MRLKRPILRAGWKSCAPQVGNFACAGFAETGIARYRRGSVSLSGESLQLLSCKHDILFFCQDNSLDRMIAALDKLADETSAPSKLEW